MCATSARPRRLRIARRDLPALPRRRPCSFGGCTPMLLGVYPLAGSQEFAVGRCNMSDFWRQCEGQVIANRFRLRHYLGGTDDSAVFLTQLAGPQSQKAAIKFITAGPTADLQLSLWHRSTELAHPNLIRMLDVGRC